MTAQTPPPFSLVRVLKVVLLIVGVALVAAAVPLIAQRVMPWRLVSSSVPVSLGSGASYVVKKIKGPVETELHLVFFDSRSCALRVVEQPVKKEAVTVAECAAANGAFAACNGGYFDVPNFTPSGLQISNGKRTGRSAPNPLAGYIAVRSGVPELAPVEQFKDAATVTEFLDCNPMYVMNGRPLQLGDGPRNARTFVMTDRQGRWAIGACRNLGLQEVADVLTSAAIMREFRVERALNLDGGPSTSLWCKTADGAIQAAKESWRVKNLLLVLPEK